MEFNKRFKELFESKKAVGVLLVLSTIISIAFANSQWSAAYTGFWNVDLGGHTLTHWIYYGTAAQSGCLFNHHPHTCKVLYTCKSISDLPIPLRYTLQCNEVSSRL